MVGITGGGVGRDVTVDQNELPLVSHNIAIPQIYLAVPERLDLAPSQGETGLESFQKQVTESRLSIVYNDFFAGGG